MTTLAYFVKLYPHTHTSSCLKKIIGDTMSLRPAVLHNVFQFTFIMSYQLNMVSLSALPCGTPAFSFAACLCVRVHACQAPPCRAFSGVYSSFQGLQRRLATVGLCGRLGWIRPRVSTRIPPIQAPKAHLLHSAGLPREVPRSPSLLLLPFS